LVSLPYCFFISFLFLLKKINEGRYARFDAQALVDSIQQQAVINEDEGWVQNVPQQPVETAINDYQTQLEDFINSQHPDATVGDVLGTSDIKSVIRESLSASLPYELRTRKLVSSELSDSQRWKIKYQLNYPVYGQAGETLLQISEPTVSLVGKKLALSFKPDTEADEQTLASYLPEPDAYGNIDPASIPDFLPGYLIHLRAEFNVGDEITTAINPAAMGTQLLSEMGYWQPGRGWKTSKNNPIAGEYRAIALDLQGISQQQAQALQNDLENTKAKIEAEDFDDLTKQDLVGDLLYSTIFSYFALNNVQDDIAAKQANIINYRAPSYGIFKTNLQPSYWFGTPRDVKTTGLAMDVDHMSSYRVAKDNDPQVKVNFNKLTGNRYSAMEHLVPEQMFSTDENKAEGISAVKAIAIAAAEGQKIYTISNENLEIALANITLAEDTEIEIRNSVNAGYVVTAHEKQINFNGWLGEGYVITDPVTGDAAYKISGGGNGGLLVALGIGLQTLNFYLIFKGLLKAIGSTAAFSIAPITAMLSGMIAVSQGCVNSEAATYYNIMLVVIALMQSLLIALLTVAGPLGVLAFAILTVSIYVFKNFLVNMILNSRVCRGN